MSMASESLTRAIAVALGTRWQAATEGPEFEVRWYLLRDDGLRLRVAPFGRDATRVGARVIWRNGELDHLPRQHRPATDITMAATKPPVQMANEIARRLVGPIEAPYAAVRAGITRQADLAAANAALADRVVRIVSGRRSTNQSDRDLQRGANVEIWPNSEFPAYRLEVGGDRISVKDLALPATERGLWILEELATLGRAA